MIFSALLASAKGVMPRGTYKYNALSTSSSVDERVQERLGLAEKRSRAFKSTMGALILAAFLFLAVSSGSSHGAGCEATGSCTMLSTNTWAQYSPFFSVPSDIDPQTPDDCEVTMALVLSRHGSRNPTASKAKAYKAVVDRIQSSVTTYGPGYEFIKQYKYNLGKDDLTLFGEREMVASGVAFYERYQALVGQSEPFIRASGSDRVIMSAQNFTHGFYESLGRDEADYIDDILVVPEGKDSNNTLDHGACPVFEDGPDSELGHDKQNEWNEIWATPIMKRLNCKLPGANLTLQETVLVMDLCPYNTVATADGTPSDFCRLFTQEEWRGYDYHGSLEKWYAYGSGNPLGSTQGVGYVNEAIARLTNATVNDGTSTNSTLDSSPDTFPLDRRLYADFSHDNTMTSVYAALGLYNATADLPVHRRLSAREAKGYSASWTVPFASRMYIEKMQCGSSAEELVRVLVNDRVVPLQGCHADRLGRCKLGAFVDGLSFATGGGRWNECFA